MLLMNCPDKGCSLMISRQFICNISSSRIEQYLCVLLNTSKAEQYLLNVTLDHSPTPTITDRWTNFVQVLHLFAWSTVQHSGTEQNRREESTCLPRGQQVHETATRGKFLSRRPPVSPSSYYHHLRPLGWDLFTLGIFWLRSKSWFDSD